MPHKKTDETTDASDIDVESGKPLNLVSKTAAAANSQKKSLLPGGLAHFFAASAKRVPTKPLDQIKPTNVRVPETPVQYEERMRLLRMQTELEIIKERIAKAEAERKELEQMATLADSVSTDVAARFKIQTVDREDSVEMIEQEEKRKSQHRSLAAAGYTGMALAAGADDDEEDDEEKASNSSRGGSRGGSRRDSPAT